jgi:flagellar hook-basal body complex protein FliE
MDLAAINSQIASAVSRASATAVPASAKAPGLDFAASLDSALQSVSEGQSRAAEMQRQFQAENPAVSLEQAMVEMNKSQLGFAAAVQVRNRLVQAYDQIMNMPV